MNSTIDTKTENGFVTFLKTKYWIVLLVFSTLLFLQTCSSGRQTAILQSKVSTLTAKTDSLSNALKESNRLEKETAKQLESVNETLKQEFDLINAMTQDQRAMSNKSFTSLLNVLSQKNKNATNETK